MVHNIADTDHINTLIIKVKLAEKEYDRLQKRVYVALSGQTLSMISAAEDTSPHHNPSHPQTCHIQNWSCHNDV